MQPKPAALSYEEQQAIRRGRIRSWEVAADTHEVSWWQAFQACCQIRKQILWAWILRLFQKTPRK